LINLAIGLSACALLGCSTEPEDHTSHDEAVSQSFRIRRAPSITHISSPVDDKGYVDYLEAANIRHSEGVTVDNNWVAVIFQVFGPRRTMDPACRDEYYARLGIVPPKEDGRYFRPLRSGGPDLSSFEKKCYEQFMVTEDVWEAEEYPEVAQWLILQERHLDILVAGSHRPKCYTPYVLASGVFSAKGEKVGRLPVFGLVDELMGDSATKPAPMMRAHGLFAVACSRDVARVLLKRAMLRIGENDISGTRSDLSAMRRIGRLLSQGGFQEYLAGRSINEMACFGYARLLKSGRLSRETCQQLLQQLNSSPPFPNAADVLDVDCRQVNLDDLAYVARHQQQLRGALTSSHAGLDKTIVDNLCAIDWNVAMKTLNDQYDLAVAAARDTEPSKLRVHVDKYYRTVHSDDPSFKDKLFQAARTMPEERSRRLGELYFEHFAPAGIMHGDLQHLATKAVLQVACAASMFRWEHGRYPEHAEDIVPMLGKPPVDPVTGEALTWKRLEDGIVIYTPGYDRRDDGGHPDRDFSIYLRMETGRKSPSSRH